MIQSMPLFGLCGWLGNRVRMPNAWLLGLVAWSLGRTGSISLRTAFLAIAPGGTAEMAIIAKTFGIGAPIVTAFHFFRVTATVLSIGWVSRTLLRTGWVK